MLKNIESGKATNWEILSLLRFVLAFVVMSLHLKMFCKPGIFNYVTLLGAFEAILGFLLISGFSIGTSILRNTTNYFVRRLQRIYPVYIACIVFEIIVTGVKPDAHSVFNLLLNFVFLNQLFTTGSFVGPAWTLATEVWLYCLAPLFLKLKLRTLFAFIFISFSAYLMYTCGRSLYHWQYYANVSYGLNLLFLAYIWIAGFALAIFPQNKKTIAAVIATLFLGHIAITIGIQLVYRIKHNNIALLLQDMPGFTGIIICLTVIYIAVVLNHKIPFSPRLNRIATVLGNVSYPLYLCHVSTFKLLKKSGIHNAYLNVIAALTVSFIIYYIFDFYSKKRVVKKDNSVLNSVNA